MHRVVRRPFWTRKIEINENREIRTCEFARNKYESKSQNIARIVCVFLRFITCYLTPYTTQLIYSVFGGLEGKKTTTIEKTVKTVS